MADLRGRTLGRYQMLERLGRGGMADVYRAYHPGLDRYVAVKVMHSHLSEESDFISRFQREAKSVANLRHNNIIQVFDFDVQDDVYFMVMEYIEGGRTLKEVLGELSKQGQRLAVHTAVEITAKLADALDYAHQRGMIHRDIKPSNVLLTDLEHPILSDFGIARLIGQTGLTGSGAMIGTPAYMSPEQGRGEKADERSDIYALGILLYEMLTGQPPYDADTPYAVILKHINEPVIPPRTLVVDLPDSVERMVLKCLAKAPADRYQTAAELRKAAWAAAHELEDHTPVTEATPVISAPPPVWSNAQEVPGTVAAVAPPPAARRGLRPWMIGGGLAGLVLCVGVIALGALAASQSGQGGEITSADEGTVEGGDAGAPIVPDTEDVASLLEAGSQQHELGQVEQAISYLERARELAPDNVEVLLALAWAYADADRSDEEIASPIMHAAEVEPDNPYVLFAMGHLHHYTETYSDHDAALVEFTRAAEGCGNQDQLCADAYGELARIHAWYLSEFDTALDAVTQALEYDMAEETRIDLLTLRAEIQSYGFGDLDAALADMEEVHNLRPEDNWPLERAAQFALESGEYDITIEYLNRLLDASGGNLNYLVARGAVQRAKGDLEAARADAERALELDPDLLGGHYLRGLVMLDLGHPEDARAELEIVRENEEAFTERLWENPLFTRDWGHDLYYDLAQAAYQMGDLDDALGYLDPLLSEPDLNWGPPYVLRGQILAEQGDLGGAREMYLRALEFTYDPAEIEEIERRLAELTG